MKTQQVSVDVWAMVKSMAGYLFLAIIGGIFLRLVMLALSFPRRLRAQREIVEKTLDEMKKRYPDEYQKYLDEAEEEDKGNGSVCSLFKEKDKPSDNDESAKKVN